jgi:hypothetical protein
VWEIKSDAILRHLTIKPAPQMAFLFRIYKLLGTQQWDISKVGGLLVIDGLGIGNWELGIGSGMKVGTSATVAEAVPC